MKWTTTDFTANFVGDPPRQWYQSWAQKVWSKATGCVLRECGENSRNFHVSRVAIRLLCWCLLYLHELRRYFLQFCHQLLLFCRCWLRPSQWQVDVDCLSIWNTFRGGQVLSRVKQDSCMQSQESNRETKSEVDTFRNKGATLARKRHLVMRFSACLDELGNHGGHLLQLVPVKYSYLAKTNQISHQ